MVKKDGMILVEKKNGKPCLPTFLKSLMYIDMSSNYIYELGYAQLFRDIYSKPLLRKPALGKMPFYLEADEPVLLSTAQEQRMLKEKAKVMFGVADKDSFKTLIARTKDELQRDAYHRIPNLKEGLSYDKVCSLR